jgi:hypothetical protein
MIPYPACFFYLLAALLKRGIVKYQTMRFLRSFGCADKFHHDMPQYPTPTDFIIILQTVKYILAYHYSLVVDS